MKETLIIYTFITTSLINKYYKAKIKQCNYSIKESKNIVLMHKISKIFIIINCPNNKAGCGC